MSNPRWAVIQGLVFAILLGSYAFFWHSRDWNTASRLILTYAMVDRGTVILDGLNQNTGDIAYFQGHYYCDKLPGFSMVAAVPYALSRAVLRLPTHPLGVPAMTHWPADYWVTLGTSGLFTALTGVLLVRMGRELGLSPRPAALIGLGYGLATPAYVYATLAYGHQLTALALTASFLLLWEGEARGTGLRLFGAGFLAALAAAVELQVGPVSAILGGYLISQCLTRRRPWDALAYFGLGAMIPTLVLLGYNVLAFGSPLEMGYFHHATAEFARVHNRDNPLGLRTPDTSLLWQLLWGRHRGLFFHAPILVLAIPGWWYLWRRGLRDVAAVTLLVAAAVLLVNLSYPEWTGGWSTGPRLLVPLLPFAMIPVAATLAPGRSPATGRLLLVLAVVLALAGGVLMTLFQGVGGRIPQDVADPLFDVVLPLWRGNPLPVWWTGNRFARNLVSLWLAGSSSFAKDGRWEGLQFAPLILGQALGILAIIWAGRPTRQAEGETAKPAC